MGRTWPQAPPTWARHHAPVTGGRMGGAGPGTLPTCAGSMHLSREAGWDTPGPRTPPNLCPALCTCHGRQDGGGVLAPGLWERLGELAQGGILAPPPTPPGQPAPCQSRQVGRRCAENAVWGCQRGYDIGQELWPLRDSSCDAGCSLSPPTPALLMGTLDELLSRLLPKGTPNGRRAPSS